MMPCKEYMAIDPLKATAKADIEIVCPNWYRHFHAI